MSVISAELQTVLDRLAITDVVNRYGTTTDRKDWAGLRGCFVERPDLDFSAFEGGEPREPKPVKADDFVAFARQAQVELQSTQHVIANHAVVIDGDTATCTAHFVAHHHLPNALGGDFQRQGGWYDFKLVRTPDGWRISGLVLHVLWNEGNWHVFELAKKLREDKTGGSS